MKYTIKFLWIIVFVTVIGFSMAGCGSDGSDNDKSTPSILTITDIPDKYNDLFVSGGGTLDDGTTALLFGDSYNGGVDAITTVQIKNNKASFKVYILGLTSIKYSGNDGIDSWEANFSVFEVDPSTESASPIGTLANNESIAFINGSAEVSFSKFEEIK